MKNPVVHFEIVGPDHQSLQRYYEGLFGWEIRNVSPETPYGLIEHGDDGVGIGGGVGLGMHGESRATFYVQVEDIHAALAKALELGGETVSPVADIPGMVTFALFKDIAGNIIGLVASEAPPAE